MIAKSLALLLVLLYASGFQLARAADLPVYSGARPTSAINLTDVAATETAIGKAIKGAKGFSLLSYRVMGGLNPQEVIEFYKKELAQSGTVARNTKPLVEWVQQDALGVLVTETRSPEGVLLLTAEAKSGEDGKAGEIVAVLITGKLDRSDVMNALQIQTPMMSAPTITRRAVSAGGVRKVRLETPGGPVWVRSADADSLHVRILGMAANSSDYRIDARVRGSEATFEVDMPSRGTPVELVAVPGVAVEVDARRGAVLLQGPLKGASIRTGDGMVAVRSVEGNVSVTASGDGAVEVVDVSGEVRVETAGGTVRGSGLAISGGQNLIKTGDGGITLELTALRGGELEARTSNGNIVVRLPRNASVSVRAKATNGTVRLGAPLQAGTETNGETTASMQGGRVELRLYTSNGNVTVEPQ
jgi:hypothetical protein